LAIYPVSVTFPEVIQSIYSEISQFSIAEFRCFFIISSSALSISGLYLIIQSKFKKFPPYNQILFLIYNQYRQWQSDAIGAWAFRHSLSGTFFGALLVSLFLALIGTEPIVVVTGLYASTLFFNRLFATDVPLLSISEGTHASSSPPDDSTRFDCEIVETLGVNIENDGEKVARDVDIYFQSFDINGYPLTPSDNYESDDELTIGAQDEESELTLSLAEQGRLPDSYYLVVRVNPHGYLGLFDSTKIIRIEDESA
jgi:hypothetical protein